MTARPLAVLLLLASVTMAAAQDRVVVGAQLATTNGALFVALGQGYFKAEGLDVEIRAYPGGVQAVTALAAGEVDLAAAELTATAFNLAGKGAIKAIAGQARENADFEGNEVVASISGYNRGVRKMEDLAGRVVAFTQLGTPYHYQLGQIARAKNFDVRNVTLKPMQTLDAVSAAVNDGRVDAAILPVDYARDLLMASQARLVGWVAEIDRPQLGALFAASKAIAARRATVEKFVRAYRRGAADFTSAMFRRDRFAKRISDARSRAVAQMIGRYIYPKLSADRAIIAIETTAYYIDPQAQLDAADVAKQVDWFKAQRLVDQGVDARAVIDASFAGAK